MDLKARILALSLSMAIWGFKGRIGTGIWALGLRIRPLSWNLGLEAGILA